ncbi:hypothetical protein KJ644_04535 [Candidatus Dependentiae bacterium]|nr:hypothetical protein [Candidatus Dependentiae bacterium]MBU4387707.1 hypothetical protein [Candidatus Dependentiae bacterium]MCG2755870.1 hypothetical protein [Candidatus Dependentiae bacterium]
MKKMLALFFCLFSIFELSAWNYFYIENDTKNKIELKYSKGTVSISPNKKQYVVNYNVSENDLMKFDGRVVAKENESEFTIAETIASNERLYTIAPKIIVDKSAGNVRLLASKLFAGEDLPAGYTYKTYPTTKITSENKNIPIIKFDIENDTIFSVKIISTDGKNKFDIPTINQNSSNKIVNIFTVNPISYKNYKLPAGAVGLPRFKYVDEKNQLKIEIEINKNIYNYLITINPEILENTVLKISNIIGFTAISDN